jgi:[ribosomal protein S5]-alanine N-acetyltransferase
MIFQTNRLLIRAASITDIHAIHELHSLPETDEFNTLGIPETMETTQAIVTDWLWQQQQQPRNSFIFSIYLIDTTQFIGLVALNLGKPSYKSGEVWYKIHKNYWHQGYGIEALRQLLQFGFTTLQLHRIEAGCAVENIASIKLLEKVGMKRGGLKRKKLPIRGQWKDNYFYALLEDDFFELNS